MAMASSSEESTESKSACTNLIHEDFGRPLGRLHSTGILAIRRPRTSECSGILMIYPRRERRLLWMMADRGGSPVCRWISTLGMKSDHRTPQIRRKHSTQRQWFSSPRSLLVPKSLSRIAVQERYRCYTTELSSWGQYGYFRCSPPSLRTHFGQVRFAAGSPSCCHRIRESAPSDIKISRRLQRFRPEPSGSAAVGENRSGTALSSLASWYGDQVQPPPPQRLTAPS